MLDQNNLAGVEKLLGDDQAPQSLLCTSTSITDDMGVSKVDSKSGRDVDTGVHACNYISSASPSQGSELSSDSPMAYRFLGSVKRAEFSGEKDSEYFLFLTSRLRVISVSTGILTLEP